ncbi:sugar transferase [Cereibacter sphaeroides]|uniref:sugar transferase n=1 Tax=Cereibacter sphaeroides TaxID=1063 RepID=UPI001F42B5C5|nr:sugar transferase [Cereibacter sphaeroides]MCE6959244.1 sugar transferase [Cereibacter sphaeroides]MCE6972047.1 sugar transferase [Cereibacter sphaeroides]
MTGLIELDPPGDCPGTPRLYQAGGKRLLDIALSIAMAPFFAAALIPVLALAASDGASPVFSQQRVGKNGRTFRVLKVRTMVSDAEARLAEHLAADPAAALEWKVSRKLRRDPRITRFGRFLRSTSLDELPQIWNVLRGDMSWVGPRPVVADELANYGPFAAVYLSLRPGITGPWQVSGRNAETYEDRVAMDVRYAADYSPAMDMKIILKTVLVVIRKTGL